MFGLGNKVRQPEPGNRLSGFGCGNRVSQRDHDSASIHGHRNRIDQTGFLDTATLRHSRDAFVRQEGYYHDCDLDGNRNQVLQQGDRNWCSINGDQNQVVQAGQRNNTEIVGDHNQVTSEGHQVLVKVEGDHQRLRIYGSEMTVTLKDGRLTAFDSNQEAVSRTQDANSFIVGTPPL